VARLKLKIPGIGKGGRLPDPGQIVHQVEGAVTQGIHEIDSATSRGVRKVEDAAEHGVGELPKLAEEAVQAALQEALKALGSTVGRKIAHLLEVGTPDTADFNVGPVELSGIKVADNLDTLKRWAQNPPSGKAGLKDFIRALAPEQVSLVLDASIAVVIQSDTLSIGATLHWSTDRFLDEIDRLLDELL